MFLLNTSALVSTARYTTRLRLADYMTYNEIPELNKKQLRKFNRKYKLLKCSNYKKTSCWLWSGSKSLTGYGQVSLNNRLYTAHRVSYHIFKGKVPPDMQLDHLCMVRHCVNPKHLEPVTAIENVRRSILLRR